MCINQFYKKKQFNSRKLIFIEKGSIFAARIAAKAARTKINKKAAQNADSFNLYFLRNRFFVIAREKVHFDLTDLPEPTLQFLLVKEHLYL